MKLLKTDRGWINVEQINTISYDRTLNNYVIKMSSGDTYAMSLKDGERIIYGKDKESSTTSTGVKKSRSSSKSI